MIFERVMPEPGRIVVAEPISPIVAMPAVLRWPDSASNSPVSGRKRKSRPLMLTPLTFAAAVAVGAVDPAVESPLETIHAVLLVAFD